MQVPPRTPKDRAAVTQRTHHPANSELKRRAAPSTHPLRSTTSKTYRDRIDSGCSAVSTADKGSNGPCRGDPLIGHTATSLMLFAALASVVIASCYDGDTCTTTTGERVRLACIDTPELVCKRAESAPAKAARDHLKILWWARRLESDGSPRIATDEPWQSYSLGRRTCSKRWSPVITQRSLSATPLNVLGQNANNGVGIINWINADLVTHICPRI